MKLHAERTGAPIGVASAGVLAAGVPADPHVIAVVREYGVDLTEKRSRLIEPKLISGADLVLTMTTAHARRIIGEQPGARGRVFTLRDFVNLATTEGPRPAAITTQQWIANIADRRTADYGVDLPEIEFADPIGEPRHAFEELAVDLDQTLEWLVRLLNLS